MKAIICSIVLLFMNNIFSSEKLVVTNQTNRLIRVLYVHSKSPQVSGQENFLPDHISVGPNETRKMPHTSTNPPSIGLEVNYNILRDFDKILINAKDKKIIIQECVPGNLTLLQGEVVIQQVKI